MRCGRKLSLEARDGGEEGLQVSVTNELHARREKGSAQLEDEG